MSGTERSRPGEWWRAGDYAWMAAVLVLGLGVRLFHIDGQPFWLDEVLTLRRIHLDLGGVVTDSFANRHMPSYFLMLHMVSQLGDTAEMLRLPSALFGALSAAMVYAITRSVSRGLAGGRSAAIVAGLLMALSPQQVQYGQEARSYTLETLLITVGLWGLVRLAQNSEAASLNIRDPRSERIGWATFLLGTVGALDVLGDAAPWLIVANISLFLIRQRLAARPEGDDFRKGFGRNWIASQVVIAAFCLPFYGLILVASDGNMLQKFDWIPALSWQHVWVSAGSVYLMRMAALVRFDLLPTAAPLLAPIVALLGGLGLFRVRARLEGRILLLAFIVLPLLFLATSLFKPMLLPRYILWSAAPFFVLAGLGICALPRRSLPAVVAGVMLLGAVNLAPTYKAETKPRWDLAAATLKDKIRPGDTVYTADMYAPAMLTELQPRNGMPLETTALVTPDFNVAMARWKQGGRVWAVHGRSGLGEREGLDAFKTRIAALGTPTVEIAQGEEITILLFPAPGGQ